MSESRKEKAERLYNQAKDEMELDYVKKMVKECYEAGLLDVHIDPATGEERYKPSAFGESLMKENL
jgi:hypothetical protein